ncbi:MAG TPA: response regulator [Pyrinomonadaceae bacterium]|nr:response regulator [Pyrinomonadaceae bacterium]
MFPTQTDQGARGGASASNVPHSFGGGRDQGAPSPFDATDRAERHEPLRVLVVDDAPDVTEMIAMMMRYAGYDVTTALSANEAFEAALRSRFDVVVSDIGMPGMNGYQLAEALRRLPEYAAVPLVAVTGFTMYDDRERARASGFDDFLTKPISPADLLDAVKRLCG